MNDDVVSKSELKQMLEDNSVVTPVLDTLAFLNTSMEGLFDKLNELAERVDKLESQCD